ncbi:class I SAM-dependent methyltransferase [Kitasatospora sp. NPDC059327]|uniref:class I SAM-dependent methyltransferase n=1 Tax=Kitasatospora sp. NPDC059327 TaxID=3346803 RepID=UPI0036B3FB3B
MTDDNVLATAYLTAVARAGATSAGLLRDPYAARFAERCPSAVLGVMRHTAGPSAVVARTVAVDRLLSELLARERAEVCVNLGAGFDSRPYRLAWPAGARVVEVDHAAVLDVKDALLPAAEALVPVERARCDLGDLDALARLLAPRTTGRRVVILAEGLLTYLPPAHLTALARCLAGLGASAHWICDVLSVDSARALTEAAQSAGTRLDMFGLTDPGVLEAGGWQCEHLELLPTARLAPRTGHTGHTPRTATSALLPDGVLTLRASPPARD